MLPKRSSKQASDMEKNNNRTRKTVNVVPFAASLAHFYTKKLSNPIARSLGNGPYQPKVQSTSLMMSFLGRCFFGSSAQGLQITFLQTKLVMKKQTCSARGYFGDLYYRRSSKPHIIKLKYVFQVLCKGVAKLSFVKSSLRNRGEAAEL